MAVGSHASRRSIGGGGHSAQGTSLSEKIGGRVGKKNSQMSLTTRVGLYANVIVSSMVGLGHIFAQNGGLDLITRAQSGNFSVLALHLSGVIGAFHLYNASLSLYAINEKDEDKPLTRAVVHSQVLLWAATLFVQFHRPVHSLHINEPGIGLVLTFLGISAVASYYLGKDPKPKKA
ncbi:hypothetical protein BC830DRAFT_853437 [Chytriomyces sp. MP71]|nr:hypothetical protein BC830DRAFT_853437 [Chytriomyces sp. MP71]